MDGLSGILFLIIFIWLFKIQKDLSKKTGSQTSQQVAPQNAPRASQMHSGSYAGSSSVTPPTMPQQPVADPKPDFLEQLVNWLKEDWLLKLGAFLLLIGFGWFVTYAFLNNWIGPAGRIAVGLLAGALLLAGGWWRMVKYKNQGAVFAALGSTVILLTTFAARELYGYFTPVSSLGLMFASTVLVALGSIKFKVKGLAVASLLLAGVAPLLTVPTDPSYVALFSYLLAIVLGTVWIVFITGWRDLTVISLLMVGFYSAPHIDRPFDPAINTLLMFAFVFGAIFYATNLAGILKQVKKQEKEIQVDLVTAIGNAVFLLAWIWQVVSPELQSVVTIGWMLAFIIGAFAIFKTTKKHEPFYIYAAVGTGLLAAATAMELEGPALTIAYAIEAGIIPIVLHAVMRKYHSAERASLVLLVPVLMSFPSVASRSWSKGVLHDDFFVLLIISAVFFIVALYFRWIQLGGKLDTKENRISVASYIIGSIFAYILLWLALRAGLANNDVAVFISLVVYTIVGLITYIYGSWHEKKVFRVYGGALLGFVVGRLLIVDVWQMALTQRIITFFVVGTMLISTAFIGRKKPDGDV